MRTLFIFSAFWLLSSVSFWAGKYEFTVLRAAGTAPQREYRESAARTVLASWYDYDLEPNDDYSKKNDTCASRTFPRNTFLLVTHGEKAVICRVNDWIAHPEREIDLSSVAFRQLAPLSRGLIEVKVSKANEAFKNN